MISAMQLGHGARASRNHSFRGFALLIVLAVVLLCSLMLIVLLERGKVDLQSASAFSQTAQVRSLADMAQNLVQAQIRDATTLNQRTDTVLNQRDTWASQPGAIRAYTPAGTMRRIYKLYSSDTMQTANPDLGSEVPGNWYTRPTEFTDMNDPVNEGGTTHYPILDPAAATLNPTAAGLVGGFEIEEDAPLASGGNPNPAPMPVRWIYALEDGTLCQLGDARIDPKDNPIIGRIAFWTDDETAKVNINTAAPVTANSYWDAPRAWSSQEQNLGWAQPAQNEYQRYPGHPGMVSLRAVLGNLTSLSSDAYFGLVPYYRWGGSEDGSKRIDGPRASLLTNKQDRAYVTVDELLFANNPVGRQSALDPAQVESLRFFLTASSRAPELNLFGQPRVTIWPIHQSDSDTRRTPYDRLIAFNSTVGGKPYYFTREQPLSATHDFAEIPRNEELYAYLQNLTDTRVPGFGGSTFAGKYGTDRDQILTGIFDYIRITNLNETYQGRDPNFLSYTSDWVGKSSIAGQDPYKDLGNETEGAGLVVPIEINDTRGMGRFPVIAEVGLLFVTHHAYPPKAPTVEDPVPAPPPEQLEAMLVIETVTPAFGYMPWCGKNLEFELKSSTLNFSVGDRTLPMFPDATEMPPRDPAWRPSVINNSAIGVDVRPIHFPPLVRGGLSPGGYDGAAYVPGLTSQRAAGTSTSSGLMPYRFFSPPLTLEDGDSAFSISGGELEINIRVNGVIVQQYTLTFPPASDLPLPIRSDGDSTYAWTSQGRPWWGIRTGSVDSGPLNEDVLHSVELAHGDARLVAGQKNVSANLFEGHANYGQPVRFAHGMRVVNHGWTVQWKGGTAGTYVDFGETGWLVARAGNDRYDTSGQWGIRTGRQETKHPKIPSGISSLQDEGWSGDFDNAWGRFADGPFINKPDEGMMHTSATTSTETAPYTNYLWSLADGLFSPLRQVPSAVMFGSLPTGVKAGIPWRTLLFCPNPVDPDHNGFRSPADHLLLDLFRMPVVEPHAISGPVSTDGKINMNYGIAPFSYIRRATSWYSLLESLKLFAVPDARRAVYKTLGEGSFNYRKSVNIEETLQQFETRFAANDIFRSATEICEIFLVPEGETLSDAENLASGFWSTHRLTGDNSREKPYAELYPKVTTQSNTYRVHMRVQVLPRSGEAPSGGKDFRTLAEYRGSRLIERYLDPDNPQFTNAEPVDPDTDSLNDLYQFRTLESRQFMP